MSNSGKETLYAKILAYNDLGWSIRKIAKKLKTSKSTVSYTLSKYKMYNSTKRLTGSGRPFALNEIENTSLLYIKKKDPKISAPKLAEKVEEKTGIKSSN